MSLMPISINLTNKQVVIIGGGKIAERKAIKILGYEAQVTVVAPELSDKLLELTNKRLIQWIESSYSKVFLTEAFLIIAATNDPNVNRAVYEDKKPYQLINIVDQPELSDFHMASTLHRGHMTISVSTEGASPILAKEIVNQLSDRYGQEYEEYTKFLKQARKIIIENIGEKSVSYKFLKELVDESLINNSERDQWFIERLQYYLDGRNS
ncbi:precorrin-2 dehydrogenase/sirohydrochlorin ferrochelatase family protein [Alkalihalobacterium elongatum]|uniref:precorrin-2 dehydrogenase/sirohydrochlorin ferrochelatase family protein n=1 Tax=Alkalihalobacterium elongatum TaxID=2675466 RepID=UPI001C1FEB3B|nr:NAD(P)-dependent oxidoreductase [Alkalihalobacterium elongatum]